MNLEKPGAKKDPLTLKACSITELAEAEMLEVFRSRFRLYRQRDLINPHERRILAHDHFLRHALRAEQGDLPEHIIPANYQLDCDGYDFEPSCKHVLIQSGPRLIAYFRVLHETSTQPLPLRELYEQEYRQFRVLNPHARVAEISRLILDFPKPKTLAILDRANELKLGLRIAQRLFQVLAQYAAKHGLTDLFAQTHPSHATMYVRHLFKIIGDEKTSRSVNNHPAVLLHHHVDAGVQTQHEMEPPAP